MSIAETMFRAAIDCAHQITEECVILRFDPREPGNNALNQLHLRLKAAEPEFVNAIDTNGLTERLARLLGSARSYVRDVPTNGAEALLARIDKALAEHEATPSSHATDSNEAPKA